PRGRRAVAAARRGDPPDHRAAPDRARARRLGDLRPGGSGRRTRAGALRHAGHARGRAPLRHRAVKPTIRPAIAGDDAAACARIYAPLVARSWVSFELDPPDAAEIARRLAAYGGSHGWLVAELDGVVAGYAYGAPHRDRAAYASSCDVAVYVDPAHSRQGLGRALYAELLPRLAGKGYHAAFAGIA